MSDQRRLNESVWSAATERMRGEYGRHEVRPVERRILQERAGDLRGRVLEIGIGAGRLTRLLSEEAGELHGIDISPVMVEHCRREFPAASFTVGDLSDLQAFATASLDAIVAGYNVLDVLDDAERAAALAEWARALRPGGLLVLSSHNLAFADRIPAPWCLGSRRPGNVARWALGLRRRIRNHRRMAAFERAGPGWAIRNDEAHDYGLLHYYASRDETARQLGAAGFTLESCVDLDGGEVPPGGTAPASSELHYVARRATS